MPDHIRHAIVSAFPDLAGVAFTVAGKGFHSLAVEAGGYIFKFPEGDDAERALRREASLLAAMHGRVTIAVPDMSLHEGPPLFSRHRMLAGRPLEPSDYAALTLAQRDRLARDITTFFAELHAIDPKVMRQAGVERVDWWDTADATLAPMWDHLPRDVANEAKAAIAAYRTLPPDPLGEVYGFFDAHGWNMAFDHAAGRLNGIFDFADSGLGPPHREFVQVSIISPDLAARTADAYERLTGRSLDRRRIFLLTAAQRLSEYAGALETGEHAELVRELVLGWFLQRDVR